MPGTPDAATVPVAPASTVIVLRDSADGPEVFLVRRHQAIAFMAGAHVFPGGRIDPQDECADASWCDGLDRATTTIGDVTSGEAAAFHVAAARELFEEAGVMLARDRTGRFLSLRARGEHERVEGLRSDLHAHRRTLRDIVTGEGLRLALDALVPYAHWVTPPIDVRRFDTRFFITRLPPDQVPVHDDLEATDSLWTTPMRAIAAAAAGRIVLPPPTWATLREIEAFQTVDDAIAWARTRVVRRREPRVTVEQGIRRIILPGDPALPEPEPVPFETRFVLAEGRWSPEPVR